ncbi:MAG: adenylyltransferase/cytidyltransferase family protein [Clostridia bacterium]|nr:adenylyltransferase/cytidyltransferase family protein [Clostridia bacterium]
MTKVITYGTFDLLHYGHINLLNRAKALGDYLIVGVTSDDYDKIRGKINNRQSLMERVAALEALKIADEVIVEEYEGQKIDDIKKYGIDIFTVGSDWNGYFDYLKDYCKVVYLPRTQGVSSTDIRASNAKIKVGIIGEADNEHTSLQKFTKEASYVNGIEIVCSNCDIDNIAKVDDYVDLLKKVDAVYITSHPKNHYEQIKKALLEKKHVLCEAPISLNEKDFLELVSIATNNKCILMEGIKTAYTTAYKRLILLAKTGKIGDILSVDATCTSLKDVHNYTKEQLKNNWNTITEWAPLALLPIFDLLGVNYLSKRITTKLIDKENSFDSFTKIDFLYKDSTASIKVAKCAKSEGSLIITGSNGYIYVPAPWWKTDYFEIRYENPTENKRFFYQLDGEGIRYEIAVFTKAVELGKSNDVIDENISKAIALVMQDFYSKKDVYYLE